MKTNKLDTIIRCLDGKLFETRNSKSKYCVTALKSITDTKLDWVFSDDGIVMFVVTFQGVCDYFCIGNSFTEVRTKSLKEIREIRRDIRKRNKEAWWKLKMNS